MMKKILIVTYYWPPSGGAAVQRWLSFANKLAQNGWEVHLLTVDPAYATYQLRDESLMAKVDSRIKVHTTKTREPFKFYMSLFGKGSIPKPAFSNETNPSFLKKVSRFIRGNFFVPDPRKGWKQFAVPRAQEIIKCEGIDTVITAGPPHSTHFIGEELKLKTGVHWIVDFHDLWTNVIYYDMLYHLPWVAKKDMLLERRILEAADLVITVGEKYKEKLLSKSGNLLPEKIKVLRIGYEESMFDNTPEGASQQTFIISYTGTIADFYEPDVFINALSSFRKQYPNFPLTLQFAGVLSGGIREKIHAAGLGGILDERGYLSHEASISLLKNATILLLVNPVTKDEEMVIPGKVYEYLAAQKPIINITKKTAETATLIEGAQAGKTFDRSMQSELEAYLQELASSWLQSGTLNLRNDAAVLQYSRKEICQQLMKLIERK